MKQEILNSENNKIQYFHKVQQVAKIIKKAHFEKSEQLNKVMLNLNTLKKEIQIFKRSKLHRQNTILTKSRHEHVKFS